MGGMDGRTWRWQGCGREEGAEGMELDMLVRMEMGGLGWRSKQRVEVEGMVEVGRD